MVFAELTVLGDVEPIEECMIGSNLKKAFEHAHVQGFSETAWAGEEVYFAPIFEYLWDQFCFIDIVKIFFPDFLKRINSNW